eukprot:TRINITY_DN2380_c0_g1_i1.p2 TRINITY_DN2380_c0_g1~~TRINITY_DN2380_c0_g1_i1.p2  ORF type:complete len:58 (-),score=4.55 TRINITY_DN2380_c0_g1_i1:281-454(-)
MESWRSFLPVAVDCQNSLTDILKKCNPVALLYNIPFSKVLVSSSYKKRILSSALKIL